MTINLKTKIIFLLIAVFYAVGNFLWWKINTPIFPMDISALHFNDIFKDGFLYYNAPLLTWIMKGVFFFFGKEYFDLQIIIVNYLFFLIGLYFIYKIGLELKDKETGNIAMILFALTPVVYGMSRQYGHQDWHVMIAMIVNIYCLIKLDDFKDRKWSILYGITVGLGLLIKDEFVAYFFMPWLYVAIRSLIEKTDRTKIINILTTIILGSLIAGCHYFRFEIIYKVLHESIKEVVPVFTIKTLTMMTIGLGHYLLSLQIFLLSLISLIWLLLKYKNKTKYILILWIFVPWLIITFMPHHKEMEYNVGYIPAIILIVSLFLSSIKEKIKISLFILVCSISFCQYFQIMRNKKPIFYLKQSNIISYQSPRASVDLFNRLKKYNLKNRVCLFNSLLVLTDTINTIRLINNEYPFVEKFDEKVCDYVVYVSTKEYLVKWFEIDHYNAFFEKEKKEVIKQRIKIFDEFEECLGKKYYLLDKFYIENKQEDSHLVRIYKKSSI